MVAEIEERNAVGPFRLREIVEAFHFGGPLAIGEKAQGARDHQRIVERPARDVGLAEDGDRGAVLRFKKPLHCGERDGLIAGDHQALAVAGGPKLQDSGDEADDYSGADEKFSVVEMSAGKQVERANRGHGKAAGLHGAEHGVRVLPERPRVEQESPETGQGEGTVRLDCVADRMLHPCVGGDDEVAREP